jgi:hypothetical protein
VSTICAVRRAGTVLILAAVLAATAPACGGSSELATGRAEQEIRRLVDDLYGDEYAVGRVRCPEHVDQEEGNTFFCLATVEGQELPVRVRQTDDDGNVRINQAEALLPTEDAEAYVADYARRQRTPVRSVSCAPSRIIIRRPGEFITCDVVFETGADGTARMQVVNVQRRIAMQRLRENP